MLGRTLNVGFGRDGAGVPSNADRMYAPLRVRLGEQEITGFFRDHYLSDLVGFVYSRMDSVAAADDLYRRLRAIGERVYTGQPLTVSLILDGENAWEYYSGNGREFLRQFYHRVSDRSGHSAADRFGSAGRGRDDSRSGPGGSRVPGSTPISTSGSATRKTSRPGNCCAMPATSTSGRWKSASAARPARPPKSSLAAAFEALLAAEGSDWCWWFGPEHSSANDAEFDAFFRKLLSEVYRELGTEAPDALAESIKYQPERAEVLAPTGYLTCRVRTAARPVISSGWARECTGRKSKRPRCTGGFGCSIRFATDSAKSDFSCAWTCLKASLRG